MKTYDVNLGSAKDGMPSSLFDPRWKEPDVAARVAFTVFCRVPAESFVDAPLVWAGPDASPPGTTDGRRFDFKHVLEGNGVHVKAGSYGELHRRYAFGTHTANFHAQAVCFCVDDTGRYLLSAVVGRFDGPWGNRCALGATFYCGEKMLLGTVAWRRAMDPAGDHRVVVAGKDPKVAEHFKKITYADVWFIAETGVTNEEPTTTPKMSRARQAAIAAAQKAKGDGKP